MTKLLADYQVRLDQLLKEQAGDLSQDDKDAAIGNAANEHSRFKPRTAVHDFAGDGDAFDFPLTGAGSPDGFEVNFSRLLSVEYPAGEREPQMMYPEDWTVYEGATETPVLRLLSATPSSSEAVRIRYSVRQTLTPSAGTIPEGHFEAVSHLAASFALYALANRYIQSTDSTIGADSVDHKSKAFEARQAAREERKLYFQALGIKEGEIKAAMSEREMGRGYPWGSDRLTHGRRQ